MVPLNSRKRFRLKVAVGVLADDWSRRVVTRKTEFFGVCRQAERSEPDADLRRAR